MKFYVYSVFDPETQCFDSRLNLGPLEPKDMAEQYRRAHVKMDVKEKAFMEGKKGVCLGTFDDETGKITQAEILEIYSFVETKEKKEGQVEGESKVEADV